MRRLLLAAVVLALAVPAPAGAASVQLMVVGKTRVLREAGPVRLKARSVRVGGRRCAVGRTPLSVLAGTRLSLRLRDYGACGRSARDAGSLYVRAVAGERARGANGWVYKVGRRAATAGAADPRGPFGRGRLRRGQRLTWFYCRLRDGGCQRTLELKLRPEPGSVVASVRGYDDEGHGVAVEGVTVNAGGLSALTDAAGQASLALAPGRHLVVATKEGTIRSFSERVELP